MAFLELAALGARYGKNTVVADLGLTAEKGEFLSILGPSGCGKTTTLRMIAGFVAPSSGTIRLAGNEIHQVPPHKRNIGYVFQNYALFAHLSVADNVAFGLKMRHVESVVRAKRAAQALDLVGLGALAARFPSQLSGGQQQRMALARALVIEPDLLLLDEPLSNLDAALRGQMRSEIRALQRRLGITTLFVTHDQAEALAMSDRIAVMDHGRLVEVASPKELCDALRRRRRLARRSDAYRAARGAADFGDRGTAGVRQPLRQTRPGLGQIGRNLRFCPKRLKSTHDI